MINSIPSPAPFSRVGSVAEPSSPLNPGWFLSQLEPIFQESPQYHELKNGAKGLLQKTKDASLTPTTQEVMRILKALYQEQGMEIKYCYHITPLSFIFIIYKRG